MVSRMLRLSTYYNCDLSSTRLQFDYDIVIKITISLQIDFDSTTKKNHGSQEAS